MSINLLTYVSNVFAFNLKLDTYSKFSFWLIYDLWLDSTNIYGSHVFMWSQQQTEVDPESKGAKSVVCFSPGEAMREKYTQSKASIKDSS